MDRDEGTDQTPQPSAITTAAIRMAQHVLEARRNRAANAPEGDSPPDGPDAPSRSCTELQGRD